MRFYEQLEKELLIEGIKEVKAKYPNIDEDKFFELIKLDPTYKEGVDSVGTYGKWILNLYNKRNLKDEDFYKVTEYLTEFEQKKKWLKQKDIGQYKTLPDLKKVLDEVSVELSQNQKDKAFKKKFKQADLNADLVYEDEKWEVWIPKDYESSCKLATNTEWCTGPSSHGNDYYYNMYTGKGPLYININKNDNDIKYQFHFPTHQYMDEYDKPINLAEFLNEKGNEGIKNFYVSDLKEKVSKIISDLKELISEDKDDSQHKKEIEQTVESIMDTLGDLIVADDFKEDVEFLLDHYIIEIDAEDFKSKSREMSEQFIQDCFEGDIWTYFDYSINDIDVWNSSILDEINQSVEDYLVELGFPADIYEQIERSSYDPKYEEYEDDLTECLQIAARDGEELGAEDEAFKDFNDALDNSAPDHSEYLGHTESGAKYKASREWLIKNIDEINYQLGYYSSSWADCFHEAFKDSVNENFNFYEPYYGWYGFNTEAFNQRLEDELYDHFNSR